jgi:hypothetical protein
MQPNMRINQFETLSFKFEKVFSLVHFDNNDGRDRKKAISEE